MSTTTTARSGTPAPPVVVAWRDYDPDACGLPGMGLGEVEVAGPVAAEVERLWELGVRRVRLPRPVDLGAVGDPGAAARAVRDLCLVRDLTARAVFTEWRLRLAPEPADAWQVLSHLQPPRELTGTADAAEALSRWRAGHYLCKCLWRQGPGFVQIRDRRWGDLRRFTADEPEYRQAIEVLSYGAPADTVPAPVLADFREERLVADVGPLAWWLPYRVRRWIQEAMTV
ncbi:hypothetical protein CUT44_23790 [Streptomyces carminius]|uniref:Uncharacterized protein n=1 Tax=Streptomyces carminius TaxID=2665496 RepID=A0A2M8LTM7_9ACTN|nr:DUF5825 family protein [Streptomyces carminius]PJE95318.1 hypothetical protein CUT44_23790 [Streptomyces carminius]